MQESWRVEALIEPYNQLHDVYQTYYRTGIAASCSSQGIPFSETGARFAKQLRFLQKARASSTLRNWRFNVGLIDAAAQLLGAQRRPEHAFGRYVFHNGTTALNIVIDAYDIGELQDRELTDWADVYFKTNYWPTREYPSKVLPLANLNPDVLPHTRYLKEARHADKEWDLCAFFRVWGGRNEVEGIEHNLRLFEALAKVKCRKYLLASLVSGDTRAAAVRLEKAGVPYTTKWVPRVEVWRIAARSRLNVIRHGMHQCIPWKMTDMLAMGACPVLDYTATTRWHVPLEENVHYLNLSATGSGLEEDRSDPKDVASRVEVWLADADRIRCIAQNTARYFDDYLTPENLGNYIIDTARRSYTASADSSTHL